MINPHGGWRPGEILALSLIACNETLNGFIGYQKRAPGADSRLIKVLYVFPWQAGRVTRRFFYALFF